MAAIGSRHERIIAESLIQRLFRLSASTFAMTIPFLFTVGLAIADRRSRTLSRSGKIGLVLATLSLGLAWKPLSDGILRSKQARNIAMHDVPAPLFDTVDTLGNTERLADQAGKVVLINVWATWCGPCRNEMPKLDRLYLARKDKGLVVFGLSDEDVSVQQKYLEKVPVSYPLLTQKGKVPNLYRDIARYPAIFLIDRSGRLQPSGRIRGGRSTWRGYSVLSEIEHLSEQLVFKCQMLSNVQRDPGRTKHCI